MLAAAVNPWRFQAHVEVWMLVGGVIALYFYATKVVGPKVVGPGEPVITRGQKAWFVAAVASLWLASDWPIHDIAEEYLYSVHMVQHLTLTLVMPPMFLLATPRWLARLVLGPPTSRAYRVVRRLSRPLVAGLVFNALIAFSHWNAVVNTSVRIGPLHYLLHTVLVVSAIFMWMSVAGPLPEFRQPLPTQMIYLFLMSVLPTVPGAWMTLADGALYSVYDIPYRMWGISVTTDQQVAGLIMKLVAGAYLWSIITVLFFRWAVRQRDDWDTNTPPPVLVERVKSGSDGAAGAEPVLTWAQVEKELASLEGSPSPGRDGPAARD